MRIFPIFVCVFVLMLTACVGSSPNSKPSPKQPSVAESQTTALEKIEIPKGMLASRVLNLLGPADSIDNDNGREIWRYTYKHAEYVYVSNSSAVQTLIIGQYNPSPVPGDSGQTLLLTIIFGPGKKVSDFNFALKAF